MSENAKTLTRYCILFFCLTVGLFWTSFGGQAFHDVWGNALATGICASAFFAMVFKVIALRNPPKPNPPFRICCAIAILLWGCWIYGEKTRFAEQAVVRTDATVTGSYFFSYAPWIDVSYQYQDAQGYLHRGEDDVSNYLPNQLWFFIAYNHGDIVPIYYLADLPHISRLVETHYMQIYVAKTFIILIGLMTLLGGIRNHQSGKIGPFFFRFSIRKKNETDN